MKRERRGSRRILAALFSALLLAAFPALSQRAEAAGGVTLDEILGEQGVSFGEILRYAEEDDPEMQFLAGFGFDRGGAGIPPDAEKAAYWYERSASLGYPMAKAMLAYNFHVGRGCRRDASLARIFWEEALPGLLRERDMGNVLALLVIGMFYDQMERDYYRQPRVTVIYRPLPPPSWRPYRPYRGPVMRVPPPPPFRHRVTYIPERFSRFRRGAPAYPHRPMPLPPRFGPGNGGPRRPVFEQPRIRPGAPQGSHQKPQSPPPPKPKDHPGTKKKH